MEMNQTQNIVTICTYLQHGCQSVLPVVSRLVQGTVPLTTDGDRCANGTDHAYYSGNSPRPEWQYVAM